MKKAAFILCVIVSHCVFGEPSSKLIDALILVESKGNVHSVRDNGKAIGILQIHKEVVNDVNKAYGTTYTYAYRKSIEKSREICKKYLILYGVSMQQTRNMPGFGMVVQKVISSHILNLIEKKSKYMLDL